MIKIERWQCDRCGALEKAKPRDYAGNLVVDVLREFQSATHRVFEWKELCNSCNAEVDREIEAMKESAAKARGAAADKRCIQLT